MRERITEFVRIALDRTRTLKIGVRRIIFSPSYITENTYQRHVRWLKYYIPLLPKLGVEKIMFIDNASDQRLIDKLLEETEVSQDQLHIYRYFKHIPSSTPQDHAGGYYPYWWRAFYRGHEEGIFEHYDAIIHNDTDFFILSQRLIDHIKTIKTGFLSLWCAKHNFPESAFTILCKDQFPMMRAFLQVPYERHAGQRAELVLPFTNVIKDFKGDRYGEDAIEQTPDMDYYAQAIGQVKLTFTPG